MITNEVAEMRKEILEEIKKMLSKLDIESTEPDGNSIWVAKTVFVYVDLDTASIIVDPCLQGFYKVTYLYLQDPDSIEKAVKLIVKYCKRHLAQFIKEINVLRTD